jgi:4a-hydroxytetrahydrobiopterin dehydratase
LLKYKVLIDKRYNSHLTLCMAWQNTDNKLTKIFNFSNFQKALDFTNKIGQIAESLQHHPTIILSWGKVIVETTTHDQGNTITQKDLDLVKLIDEIEL